MHTLQSSCGGLGGLSETHVTFEDAARPLVSVLTAPCLTLTKKKKNGAECDASPRGSPLVLLKTPLLRQMHNERFKYQHPLQSDNVFRVKERYSLFIKLEKKIHKMENNPLNYEALMNDKNPDRATDVPLFYLFHKHRVLLTLTKWKCLITDSLVV